jgi:hypothetical protein
MTVICEGTFSMICPWPNAVKWSRKIKEASA